MATSVAEQPTICVRCKSNAATAFFRDAIYCQACALAVFENKAKSGLEYARGAGLAKYVAAAAARFNSVTAASSPSTSASALVANADTEQGKEKKTVSNGGGNAEVNVSANIAIAFSGGPSSRALLRTAARYFRPESSSVTPRMARRKKAKGEPIDASEPALEEKEKKNSASHAAGRSNEIGKIYAIYIDDSAVIPGGVDRTVAARKMVEDEQCPDLQFVGMTLEDVYRTSALSSSFYPGFNGVDWIAGNEEDSQRIAATLVPTEEPKAALKALFASLHPANTPRTGASSARTRTEDLHRILIHTLLRQTANYYNCAALLLGDSATRISIRLIEDLAKGAGHKLPVAGRDAAWVDDLLVVRPLRAHLMQEVMYYNFALGLEELKPQQHIVPPAVSLQDVIENKKETAPVMDKSSIARLTETFILNLEKGVSSTVTAIEKTGSKLILNNPGSGPGGAQESVAHSTAAFQKVGPSVSLRTRKPLSDSMSTLSVSSKPDASEPRIGSRGMRLAQNSSSCFRWSTRQGCALCGMPSQHPKARFWKRDITISSLTETTPSKDRGEAEKGQGDGIELADWLCYACLLVLSAPVGARTEVLLPAYVLEHVQRQMAGDAQDEGVGVGGDGRTDELDDEKKLGEHGQCASKAPSQPLKREEIKAQINEFLLDDE